MKTREERTTDGEAATGADSRASWATTAPLLASAFVLLGLLLARIPEVRSPEPVAHAGNVSEVADYTVLTTSAGTGSEVLALLDRREEVLYIYGIKNNNEVELHDFQKLPEVYEAARRR